MRSGPGPLGGDGRAAHRPSGIWRRLALVFLLLTVATSALAFWALRQLNRPPEAHSPGVPWPPQPAEDRRVLEPASFSELPGWLEDDVSAALPPFLASCRRTLRRPPEAEVRPREIAGTVEDWREVCRRGGNVAGRPEGAVRAFFESSFDLFALLNNDRREGLYTGYYEPTLKGSRRRRPPYLYPLYQRPRDLVQVDLGSFREDLRGRRIAGRLRGARLEPYPDRSAIDGGAVAGKGLELLWVDDPVDAFFLHIQGSGRVELAEGGFERVGYAGQNGHPYVAIGRELVARGAMELAEVSMQSIRDWLVANPREGREVMAANPSYVFFRRLEEAGPVGSQGVVLTAGRSLAVDRGFLPMGAPLWLDATMPALAGAAGSGPPGDEPLQRLFIAQDTGGAIRGPLRGDVFWGPGDEAAQRAGRMKHRGRMWILLPKGLVKASR